MDSIFEKLYIDKYFWNYIIINLVDAFIWNRKKAPWRVILRKTGSRWYNTLGSFRRIWLIRMLSGRVSRPPLIWQRPDIEAKAHFVMVVVYVHSWISSQCILYIFIPSTDWNYFPCIVYLIGFVKTLAIKNLSLINLLRTKYWCEACFYVLFLVLFFSVTFYLPNLYQIFTE